MSILDAILNRYEKEELQRQEAEAQRRGVSVEVIKQEEAEKEQAEQERSADRERQRAAEKKIAQEKEQERRVCYGEALGLPVPAHNGGVINIGGLTARSDGSGMTKASVWHVVLDGDMSIGRLHRQKGDLLCKPASRLGRRSMGIEGTDLGEPGEALSFVNWSEEYVTCKACLEQMKRFSKT